MLSHKSPYEMVHGQLPNFRFLKVFGCACFPFLRPYNQNKLQFRSAKCVFIGYSSKHKGYLCVHSSGKVYVACDVLFNEVEFPLCTGFPSNCSTSKTVTSICPSPLFFVPVTLPPEHCTHPTTLHPLEVPNTGTLPTNYVSPLNHTVDATLSDSSSSSCPLRSPNITSQNSISVDNSPTYDMQRESSPQIVALASSSDIPTLLAQLHRPCPHSTYVVTTRSRTGVFKPKCLIVSVSSSLPNLMSQEPSLVAEALSNSNWKKAMNEEYNALIKNGTWTLVPFSEGMNIVDNKWVFRLKYNPDGSVQRYKARLVTKGFQQTAGIDFTETFSLVIKPCTIWVILTFATSYHWDIQLIDINNEFLNGDLQEEVFMSEPEGFSSSKHPSSVCKLNKALYIGSNKHKEPSLTS